MLVNPAVNQRVVIRYAKSYSSTMPLHGLTGTVVVVGKGRPRNHGVNVGGKIYAIPCGNLFKGDVK